MDFIMNIFHVNITKMINYLLYFVMSLALFVMFFKIYIKFTPVDEIDLIKNGNKAVSISFGGALIGYAVNLCFAMFYSYDVVQYIVFAIFSALIQLVAYLIMNKVFSQLHKEMWENENVAAGIFFGVLALSVGVLNGASAY